MSRFQYLDVRCWFVLKKTFQYSYHNESADFHFPVTIASYSAHPPKTAPSSFPLDQPGDDGMNTQRGITKSYDNNVLPRMTGNKNNCKMTRNYLLSERRSYQNSARDINNKLTKPNERIIKPSKHGFHPRSYSPTFKCLVEASEKLHILIAESSKYNHGMSDLPSVESSVTLQDGSLEERCAITSQYGASESDYTDSISTMNYSNSASDTIAAKRNGAADIKINDTTSEIHLFLPHLPDESKRKYKKEFVQRKHVVDACTVTESNMFPVINGIASNNSNNNGIADTSHRARAEIPNRKRTQNRRSLSPPKQRGKNKLVRTKTFDLHEPYLKGEMLKETLDDFPTLVSQRSPD